MTAPLIRPVVARCVHMVGETDAHHRVVPTCHAVGWVAPLTHVADNQGSSWSQSTAVTCGLNQSCVCNLMKGHFPELQDFFDTDWRHKIDCCAEPLIRPVAARCVHMAGETDAHHGVVPTCHVVGWVAPLAHVADTQGSG